MPPPLGCSDSSGRRRDCLVLLALLSFLLALHPVLSQSDSTPPSRPRIMASPQGVFVDQADQSGLHCAHFNGLSGNLYLPEITGSGTALLDYDNDGDLDVYLVQGNALPWERGSGADPAPAQPFSDRLFRNDLAVGPVGTPTLHFTDVTPESGIEQAQGYGMGVATEDINNDGWMDVYVTNFGSNQLFLNQADGSFRDVTNSSGTQDRRWSTSATFLYYDRDGWLDLFVANYVKFDPAVRCYAPSSAPGYCGPQVFEPEPDRLFRNRGDGTFEDLTPASGLREETGCRGWV